MDMDNPLAIKDILNEYVIKAAAMKAMSATSIRYLK